MVARFFLYLYSDLLLRLPATVRLGGLLPISGKHMLGQPSLTRRFSSFPCSTHRLLLLRWSQPVIPSAFVGRRHLLCLSLSLSWVGFRVLGFEGFSGVKQLEGREGDEGHRGSGLG